MCAVFFAAGRNVRLRAIHRQRGKKRSRAKQYDQQRCEYSAQSIFRLPDGTAFDKVAQPSLESRRASSNVWELANIYEPKRLGVDSYVVAQLLSRNPEAHRYDRGWHG